MAEITCMMAQISVFSSSMGPQTGPSQEAPGQNGVLAKAHNPARASFRPYQVLARPGPGMGPSGAQAWARLAGPHSPDSRV